MKKKIIYRYLGTNGIIDSPIHLEDTYYIRLAYLTSDLGKKLTNGDKITDVIQISEEELDQWYEIDDPNGQL